MRRVLRLGLFALPALVAGACATMIVGSHVARGVDFAGYRTFAWGPADALPTGDPRLDANPFFHEHFRGLMERALEARGLRRATADGPDLLLHYHANISQRVEVNDAARGYCYGEDCRATVIEFEEGTIVLDMVDTRTNRVVWRGWAQENMEGKIADQSRLEAHLGRVASRILAAYPVPPVK
jgi:hypothetical protein